MVVAIVMLLIMGLAWAAVRYVTYRRWRKDFTKSANRRRGIG